MPRSPGFRPCERTLDETFEESLHPRYLLSVFDVDVEADVEIAVANVTDNRSQQIVVSTIALGFGEAFGKSRDQNAASDAGPTATVDIAQG
jgi:hypothetical protein